MNQLLFFMGEHPIVTVIIVVVLIDFVYETIKLFFLK